MRTEHGKSYMVSTLVAHDPEDADNCGFCKRNPAVLVKRLAYSRNGYQENVLVICCECSEDLIRHLSPES